MRSVSSKFSAIMNYSFIRFSVVGTLNTLIDFFILNLLVIFGYTGTLFVFGQSFLIANILAFLIAMLHSFIWNRLWVFPGSRQKPSRQIIVFVVITVISCLVVNQVVFNVFYYNLLDTNNVLLSLNLAKLLASTVSVVINFFGYKYMAFVR